MIAVRFTVTFCFVLETGEGRANALIANRSAVVLRLRGSDWQTHISVMHNVTMKAVLTVRAVKTIEADAPEAVNFSHGWVDLVRTSGEEFDINVFHCVIVRPRFVNSVRMHHVL